ncbi:hypothetical protein [Fusibacter sp. JL216-2]|uniref:hypothetical protein n=1 Tax=Fusibacter sp. JL216-2 TaxID=3071453 RepID=UPI003D349534
MPKLSRTLKKALRLQKNKGKYVEVDALLNKKEKQQLVLTLSILAIPVLIGLIVILIQ